MPACNLYLPADDGLGLASLYNELGDRVVGPLLETDQPNAPPKRECVQAIINRSVDASLTGRPISSKTAFPDQSLSHL